MKNLNSLVNLVSKLSRDEYRSLDKFLNLNSTIQNTSKSQELLNLILNKNETNPITIQNILYGKINNYAFNKLVDRLNTKTLEVLMFNTNINKKIYSERVRVIFDLKKKLIQCDLLSLKGLRDDSDLLCKKIITKAKKYELFDIVSDALSHRQSFINIRKKSSFITKIENEIKYADSKYSAIINSQFAYNYVINKINNSSESITYYQDLKEAIRKIGEEYKKYNSNIIGYYLYFLQTEYYQIHEDYIESSKCLSILINLLKNKSIFSDSRLGGTYLNIANNYLHLNQLDQSVKYAELSLKYFVNNDYNKALVEECLFYAYFYKKNYRKSTDIVNKLLKLPIANNISFNLNKWIFYSAVNSFVRNDFHNCILQLNNVTEINKDVEGWNINKRLIIIMTRIELKEYESVDLNVSSLERFIKRSLKNRDIRLRYIYILRILIKLINSNYDFDKVRESRKKYLELLNSTDNDLKWKIKSPEFVPFNNWFISKCSN